MMIESILDAFKAKYAHVLVDPTPINVTACFSSAPHQYLAPRSYGDLQKNTVLAYTVFGGAFLEKYAKDEHGRLRRDQHGHPIVKSFDLECLVVSSMCLTDIRSTSLHEVKDALQLTKAIQGYRRWHIRKIEHTIQAHHPTFRPERDSAFIFADTLERVVLQVKLSALWFAQILARGSRIFASLETDEAELMERIFPQALLAGDQRLIEQRSYMYDRPIHTRESVEFLSKKVAAYQRRKARTVSKTITLGEVLTLRPLNYGC